MTGALRCDLGRLCGGVLALMLLLPGCGGDGDSKTLAEKLASDPEKEALERYALSEEEFALWRAAVTKHGENGLKVTAIQKYRQL